MRIVGGAHKGTRLNAPARGDARIRPTSDRLRESLFNILAHGFTDERVRDARVLDLFAGTGALGLEALSRGARFCLFVEDAAAARALVRANIEALHMTGHSKLFRRDATRLGDAGTLGRFDLVFADPPYGKGLAEEALASALAGGWLADDALIVVEETADAPFEAPQGLAEIERRRSGDSQLIFLQGA